MNADRMKMTADEAQTFGRVSIGSMVILSEAAAQRGCNCQPYADWYTYERWLAQGYQVQRGQHGIKLATYREFLVDKDDPSKGTRSTPWHSTVFCRCQVQPVEQREAAA